MGDLKLGMTLGYWGRGPRRDLVELSRAADDLGLDSIWVAESWGNDAFTFATWIAAHTARVRIGTGIAQLAARTPVATAMAAITLDHLSNGRFLLGLGVSGPQVVEGWYGQPSTKPLARTREYVEIVRRVLRRDEPLEFKGEFHEHPYAGPGSVGMGKPLKVMVHPLRRDLPVFLAAEGPKNVAQTAAIADGWLPLFYSPMRTEVYAESLASAKAGFEVAAVAHVHVTDDVSQGLRPVKEMLALYMGGMGAKGENYHSNLLQRMGFADEAARIQDLFLAGRREDAIAAVPDAFADEISLVGPRARIEERLELWRKTPVTTMLVEPRYPAALSAIRDLFA